MRTLVDNPQDLRYKVDTNNNISQTVLKYSDPGHHSPPFATIWHIDKHVTSIFYCSKIIDAQVHRSQTEIS